MHPLVIGRWVAFNRRDTARAGATYPTRSRVARRTLRAGARLRVILLGSCASEERMGSALDIPATRGVATRRTLATAPRTTTVRGDDATCAVVRGTAHDPRRACVPSMVDDGE